MGRQLSYILSVVNIPAYKNGSDDENDEEKPTNCRDYCNKNHLICNRETHK